jgi:hypothetical protein
MNEEYIGARGFSGAEKNISRGPLGTFAPAPARDLRGRLLHRDVELELPISPS